MYFWQYFLGSILILVAVTPHTKSCKACLGLDEYSFDKVTSKFDTFLLKLDVPHPYGDKDKTFTKFAEEVSKIEELLITEVGIKKDEDELAKRFEITKKDLPLLKLFVRGKQVAELTKNDDWNLDKLRNLVNDNTDIYVGLPGCLEEFDKLAYDFVRSGNKKKLLEETESEVEKVKEEDTTSAVAYVKFMKKIIDVGTKFVTQESERLKKILTEGKIAEKKQQELTYKVNILKSFSLPKDEL